MLPSHRNRAYRRSFIAQVKQWRDHDGQPSDRALKAYLDALVPGDRGEFVDHLVTVTGSIIEDCVYCRGFMWADNLHYLHDDSDERYCDHCYGRYTAECTSCEDRDRIDDLNRYGDDYYCDGCFNESFFKCRNCG